jgi:hypothetical protein
MESQRPTFSSRSTINNLCDLQQAITSLSFICKREVLSCKVLELWNTTILGKDKIPSSLPSFFLPFLPSLFLSYISFCLCLFLPSFLFLLFCEFLQSTWNLTAELLDTCSTSEIVGLPKVSQTPRYKVGIVSPRNEVNF